MKEQIIDNLGNPRQLEKLYRENKTVFKKEFNSIYPEVKDQAVVQIWHERLNYETDEISWGSTGELLFVLIAAFIAGLIAKIPDFAGISHDYFYPRNISFIVLPLLSAYFAWKQQLDFKKFAITLLVFLVSAFYINFLPNNENSDTLILACIHLPLFLWSVLGYTFAGYEVNNLQKRLGFLSYNGDLVVMSAILVIAGGITTAITFGLFELIGIKIEEFYSQYVIVFGLSAVPFVATYLVQINPQLVNKVSPVVAKIFSPIVLVTLVVYLIAIIYTGKDPYNDREFLMIFNVLLAGVMAIILFSINETTKKSDNKLVNMILLALSIVTIIVNGIALSAIMFRIFEWGITPNRLAVLGSNALMLTNLLLVTYRLVKTINSSNAEVKVENSIASFLPVYVVWTIIVAFAFPLIFGFR